MSESIVTMLSNRHVHSTDELNMKLFGYPKLTPRGKGGTSEYAAEETVTLVGPKGKIEGVRMMCDTSHASAQVEILKSDCFVLGVNAPIRYSGDMDDAATLTLVGPAGEVSLNNIAIIALRHIHMGRPMMARLGVKNWDFVSVKFEGERALAFHRVLVREGGDQDVGVMHIDMEEGNAANIKNNTLGEVFVCPES